MRTISTLLTALATSAAWAQPEITVNNLPHIGDISTIGICSDDVDPTALNASAGALQTWDFSGLTETSEENFTFVSPAATNWANDFPGSDLCGESWDGSSSYYITGNGALETEGNALIIPGTPPEDTAKVLITADHERIVELPYTFGDGFTDTFSGTFNALGFIGTVTGTVDLNVDGYGTLILPNATYTNVVRYHLDRVQENTILGNTSTQTKEQWAWVSADHRFWILLMETIDDGFGTSDVVWYDKNPAQAGPTAINEPHDTTLRIRPNPVEVGSPINIDLKGPVPGMTAELLDATGRSVRKFGPIATELSTEGLVAGTYVLHLVGPNGIQQCAARVFLH